MGKEKFRVLLAEGVPGEAAESLRALYPEPDGNLDLNIVSTIPTLLATVELAAPETIFFDLSLGRPDPLEAVRRVHRTAPGIPLIVIADIKDRHLASRSISEGAIDYLLKGFMDRRKMQRVLRTGMERNTLEGLADLLRDPLTGLHNREGFTALGTRAMEEATRSGGHAGTPLRADRELRFGARGIWFRSERRTGRGNDESSANLLPAKRPHRAPREIAILLACHRRGRAERIGVAPACRIAACHSQPKCPAVGSSVAASSRGILGRKRHKEFRGVSRRRGIRVAPTGGRSEEC